MADRPPDDYFSAPTLTITFSLPVTQYQIKIYSLEEEGSLGAGMETKGKPGFGKSL